MQVRNRTGHTVKNQNKLGDLLKATKYLHAFDEDMTISRLRIFLLVASSRDGNVLVRDLEKATGLGQSTIARTLAILGDGPLRGKKGALGLVRGVPDPDDPRRNFYSLSPKGRRFLSNLLETIEDI